MLKKPLRLPSRMFHGVKLGLILAISAFTVAAPTIAQAQDNFPNRPVRLVVPFAAGGQTDVLGRALAAEMSKILGQPMVVENRTGAAGAIGADAVATAAPDGYTVCLCGSGPMILLPLIDPASRNYPQELIPVGLMYLSEYVLIGSSSLKPNNAQELVADIKANPGKYTFGSSGSGGIQQLGVELLSSSIGSKMIHIPYKGEQPAALDVAAGNVNLLMSTFSTAAPLIKAGKVKPFAVTGAEHNAFFPDLPTLASLGLPDMTVYTHGGLNVPRGTPQAVVDKLNAALVAAMKAPDMVNRIKEYALITPNHSAQYYGSYVKKETEKWGKITKSIEFKRQ